MHLNPWNVLLIAIAGWMNREQVAVIEYLKEENRVLRELLGKKRPHLNDEQRRRLAGITHWVDFKLWPRFPSLMHLYSLVCFGGVVVLATFFYQRMICSAWIAGLAALLFAVDDAHGMPAVWPANRNAMIGVLFSLLTLIAYDRWRRDGCRMGAAGALYAETGRNPWLGAG